MKGKGGQAENPQKAFVTLRDAEELGLTFEEPACCTCPWCGRVLEPLGAVLFGRVRWISHERCGCEGEARHEEAECEETRKHVEEAMARRVAASGVKERYRDARTSIPAIASYLDGYDDNAGSGLYIHGEVGSGKTYAATALTRALVYAGYSVILTTTTAMLDSIQDAYGRGHTSADGIGRFMACDMLVLDDMGKENGSGWAVSTLFQVINARYESMRPIVITSQYGLDGLERRLARGGERESAAATVSRLRQICADVCLQSFDRRRRKEV